MATPDEHLLDVIDESQPATSPELLGAVVRTSTSDVEAGAAGIAPSEGSEGVLREVEGQCQGPSPDDSSHTLHLLHIPWYCRHRGSILIDQLNIT